MRHSCQSQSKVTATIESIIHSAVQCTVSGCDARHNFGLAAIEAATATNADVVTTNEPSVMSSSSRFDNGLGPPLLVAMRSSAAMLFQDFRIQAAGSKPSSAKTTSKRSAFGRCGHCPDQPQTLAKAPDYG